MARPVYDVVDLSAHVRPDLTQTITGIDANGDVFGYRGHYSASIGVIGRPGARAAQRVAGLGGAFTNVSGLNASGRFVGGADLPDGHSHPFLSADDGNTLIDLGSLGGGYAFATGINASAQVAGTAQLPPDAHGAMPPHGFITAPGGVDLRDIGTLGGTETQVFGINDAGQVVGDSTLPGDENGNHAFITGPNGEGLRDLGTFGGFESSAQAINASGQVAGWADTLYATTAFITGPDGVGMRPQRVRGGGEGLLLAINDHGVAVGFAQDRTFATYAVVTNQDDELVKLDDLVDLPAGVTLTVANGINNRGEIVATGADGHSYLLRPRH